MKRIILITFFLSSASFTQHLPLKIGNQWHYDVSAVPGGTNYAAIATDTVIINSKTYYKIERRNALTGELLTTTYDRLEGESVYYRNSNNQEKIIINFNWPVGYTRVTTTDSVCFDYSVLSSIGMRNVWGFNTQSYSFQLGFWCIGMPDTTWLLFNPEIVREFGCYWAGDGALIGAVINGVVYGTLYPLPVELINFSATVNNSNVQINWTTATETNNHGFEIERILIDPKSEIGNPQWTKIGFVEGQGTTTEPQFYSFLDESVAPGEFQYKLKQIDFDGSFEYSKIVEVTVKAPKKFSLSQNYPNPFNPTTKIKYTIPTPPSSSPLVKGRNEVGFVSLKVFDVLGNEVVMLVNKESTTGRSGTYEVEFDATGLPSGIYFYRLKAGNFSEIKKMVLLK